MQSGFLLTIVFNHSIILAAIIGMIRFKSIHSDFYPFIYILWLGLINETLSLIFIYTNQSNTINSNLFVYLEYLLFLWLFYKWHSFHRKFYYILIIGGLAIWIADNFILHSITRNNSMFRVFASFVIVFLSIDRLNIIVIFEKTVLHKNVEFIICVIFLIYFVFKSFVEAFNMFHLSLSKELLNTLWVILGFVNFITNLLYALVTLWIPTKQKFILPY